jgi:Predicted permeases
MIGRTLFRYVAVLFLKWILGLFLGVYLLSSMIDLLEVLRIASGRDDFDLFAVVAVSALRMPVVAEQVLPFAVLVGSMGALLTLSRRSELAVSRSAGLSVWQFTAPGILVALAVGIVATTLYNPAATWLKGESDRIAASGATGRAAAILGDASSRTWLRQHTVEGDSVIRVTAVAEGGALLLQPTFWQFGEDGRLLRRIDADRAILAGGVFRLDNAAVDTVDGDPRRVERLEIPASVTPELVTQRLASPTSVSFWSLPATIAQATGAGLPPDRFSLQFYVLLVRPALLAAMVLIAATVSLGMSRKGNVGRMILGGITAGFMLYVFTEIFGDLGSEGLVPPLLAAVAPAFIALSLGATVLLFQEDG